MPYEGTIYCPQCHASLEYNNHCDACGYDRTGEDWEKHGPGTPVEAEDEGEDESEDDWGEED